MIKIVDNESDTESYLAWFISVYLFSQTNKDRIFLKQI
jgi:hypothetical protein